MPISARTLTPQAVKVHGRHGHAFSQNALIHLGAVIGARYLSQQVKSPLAKSLIYTAAISGASWIASLLWKKSYKERDLEREF
jgi:hypothetical protein